MQDSICVAFQLIIPTLLTTILLLLFCKKKKDSLCEIEKEAGVYVRQGSDDEIQVLGVSQTEKNSTVKTQKSTKSVKLPKLTIDKPTTIKELKVAKETKKEVKGKSKIKAANQSKYPKSNASSKTLSPVDENIENSKETKKAKTSKNQKQKPQQKASEEIAVNRQMSIVFKKQKTLKPNGDENEDSEKTQETRVRSTKKEREKDSMDDDEPLDEAPRKQRKQIVQLVNEEEQLEDPDDQRRNNGGVAVKTPNSADVKKSNRDTSKKYDITQIIVLEKEKEQRPVKEKRGGDIKEMFKTLARDPRVMSILSEVGSSDSQNRSNEDDKNDYNNPVEVEQKRKPQLYKTGRAKQTVKWPEKKKILENKIISEPNPSVKEAVQEKSITMSKVSKTTKLSQRKDLSEPNSNPITKGSIVPLVR